MKKIFSVLVILLFVLGCATAGPKQQQGTVIGGAVGAAGGAAIGHAYGGTEGAIIGGLIGAMVGGFAGSEMGAYMDKQEAALNNALASSVAANQASIQRSQDVLVATFKGDVFFDFNSAVVKPGGQAELYRVANVLKQYPQTRVQVQGFTDSYGSEEYNLNLSQRRAEAVKAQLIQMGINASRITAIGFGESQPISNDPSKNRRVSIVLTPAA